MFITRLINSGSNCYMNSTLQGISSCPAFIAEINELAKKHDTLNNLQIFKELLQALTDGKQREINARENQVFNHWRKKGQQDSFELFSYVINEVYLDLRKELQLQELNKWVRLQLPMRINILYELECSLNHRTSCPLQTSLALHVPIPNEKQNFDIQMLVDRFCSVGDIEDYICDKCTTHDYDMQSEKDSTGNSEETSRIDNNSKGKSTSNKGQSKKRDNPMAKKHTYLVGPLPSTICVHLQRTQWNGFRMAKIDKKIKISEDLQLKYLSSEDSKIEMTEIFKLRSVIVHSGTPIFGHYICYKKVNDEWFYTSDRSVNLVNTKSVPDCQAYILFYEKTRTIGTVTSI